jgi:hypothetical protein
LPRQLFLTEDKSFVTFSLRRFDPYSAVACEAATKIFGPVPYRPSFATKPSTTCII